MDTLPVPLEVMQAIFMACLTDSPLHPNEAPLLLARVCREWRRVTFATTLLWTTLHISTRIHAHAHLPLSRWLELSQTSPIDFDIDFESLNTSEDTQDSYMEILCAHASRWRRARFVLPYEVPASTLVYWLHSKPLPLLHSLQLCLPVDQAPFSVRWPTYSLPRTLGEKLSSAPLLRTLCLDASGHTDPIGDLHSQSLVNLGLTLYDGLEQLDTLEKSLIHCPNIKMFSINFFPISDLPPVMTSAIKLPGVRALRVKFPSLGGFEFIMNKFWTPNLESLDLFFWRLSQRGESRGLIKLQDLLASCTPTLRKLAIGREDILHYSAILLSVVGLFNLTSLTLYEIYDPSGLIEFFKAITLRFTPSGRLSLPQNVALQHIALDIQSRAVQDYIHIRTESLENSFVAVAEMVLSRYRLPDNATAFDGQSKVQALKVFEVGENFAELYLRQYPAQWLRVMQGWKDMEGVVWFAGGR